MNDRFDDPSHHEQTFLPWSSFVKSQIKNMLTYISMPVCLKHEIDDHLMIRLGILLISLK